MASKNLLADKKFYALVRREKDSDQASLIGAEIADAPVTVIDAPPQASAKLDPVRLRRAVATVPLGRGHGTGFVIADGLLMTNEHVVGGAKSVRLVFGDGAEINADVHLTNARRDIALIRFADAFIRPALPLETQPPKIGDDVFSYGIPLKASL